MAIRIGVDVGGTFTDVVAVDDRTARAVFVKVPTTPEGQALGVLAGVAQALDAGGWRGADVSAITHGTTVATNLILEQKGARTALLTTAGFRDLLYIGRQTRPSLYDSRARRPEPLATRDLTLEVLERIGPDGRVSRPLETAHVEEIVRELVRLEVASVAVVLLHSYANPVHERLVHEVLARLVPTLPVSLSSEVLPVPGEYERASTTVMNAYVMPPMQRYLAELRTGLQALGVVPAPSIMQSNGGVMAFETAAREKSVYTCLSGPAAGVLGAARVAGLAGYRDVVSVDMGGTSFDVSLVLDGCVVRAVEGWVGAHPLRLPMLDILTLGAGGGSLASVDAGGLLRVGPESAGSRPGPACYGRGGRRPTVTDANAVLGRLRHGRVLGGAITVDRQHAWDAIETHVARPMGVSVPAAAAGICQVVNASMVRGIRVMTVERGHDPRDFALLAFGGCGPLHACDLAEELGVRTVIIPPTPGLCCAVGLLAAGFEHDFVRTLQQRLDRLEPGTLERARDELAARAGDRARQEGVSPDALRLDYSLDLQYAGQGHPLTIAVETADPEVAVRDFHAAHRARYGYERRDHPVEFVSLRLLATTAPDHRPLPLPTTPARDAGGDAALAETLLLGAGSTRAAAVMDRHLLASGMRVRGPVLLEQEDTTVYVGAYPARVDGSGNILIELGAGG